jgi:hypothetical protein
LKRHLVVTLHGIRTFGQWQERLEILLREADPDIDVYHFKYGYFSILAFVIPPLRWLVTARFRQALLHIAKARDWQRIDIVAHSFGTHLAAWAMMGIKPADKRPHIHTLVLAGSVLKQTFPWSRLIGQGVSRVVNDCGTQDAVLLLNQLCVLLTGMAGREGFIGLFGETLRNRFFAFGHSGYFKSKGQAHDDFMREHWLPVLLTDEPLSVPPDPRIVTPLRGAMIFAASNAEPIKLIACITPFVLAIIWLTALWREAVTQREHAIAHQLAAQAELLKGQPGNPAALSLLLGVESLRRVPLAEADHIVRQSMRTLVQHTATIDIAPYPAAITFGETGQELIVLSADQHRLVFDAATGRQLREQHYEGRIPVATGAFSDAGRFVVTCMTLGETAFTYGVASVQPLRQVTPGGRILSIATSPDSHYFATVSMTGKDAWVFRDDHASAVTHLAFANQVSAVVFSPSARYLATEGVDGRVRIFEVEGGREVWSASTPATVAALEFGKDGRSVVVGNVDGVVRALELST